MAFRQASMMRIKLHDSLARTMRSSCSAGKWYSQKQCATASASDTKDTA